MKSPKGLQVIERFEEKFPKHLAMDKDPIGLQVGTLNKPVKKIMTALDLSLEVMEEAIENQVDVIMLHHPPIFSPLKSILTDLPYGQLIEKAIKHDIAIYAAHTNLDIANGGINDALAERIGLEACKPLIQTYMTEYVKLVVFVPMTHREQVFEALCKAGAGHIGEYSHCTFQIEGKGTFLPHEGTNPFIGQIGELERVDEVRIETILPRNIQSKVVKGMIEAHPYEEVAYDLYPLHQQGKTYGLGRIGKLPQTMQMKDFIELVKEKYNISNLRLAGDLNKSVSKVAIIGGDGGKYYSAAKRAGADVFITGDLYYHVAQDAITAGMNILDVGHHVEEIAKEVMKNTLDEICEKEKWDVEVIPSTIKTEPFQFV